MVLLPVPTLTPSAKAYGVGRSQGARVSISECGGEVTFWLYNFSIFISCPFSKIDPD